MLHVVRSCKQSYSADCLVFLPRFKRMPIRCVAAGCSQYPSDTVSLQIFPKDEKLRKQWTKQVQRTRDKWSPTPSSHLCSDHFTEDCFEARPLLKESFGFKVKQKRILKPGAVPTVFKRKQENVITEAVTESVKQRRKSAVTKLAQKRVGLLECSTSSK